MRILVVGLGSMGKRRVRNLRALGIGEIGGFDSRSDRRVEAVEKYHVVPFQDFDMAFAQFKPEAMVISTGPRHHMDFAELAASEGVPCFIEASVVEADRILALHHRIQDTGLVMAPSCTMRYFPGPRKVREWVVEGVIGQPLSFNYHTGQYLPDWHPWEPIQDFYVSERETGGGREIVPFELTWLKDVFGEPVPLACVKAKLSDLEADIDDLYHCLLRFGGQVLGSLTVEVLSRPHVSRELRVIGTEGQIVLSADENCVRYSRVGEQDWTRIVLDEGTVESGYVNPEEPYIAEMSEFLAAVSEADPTLFPNNLLDDWSVLQVLERLESLSEVIP